MLRKLGKLAGPVPVDAVRLTGLARFGDAELSAAYVGNGTHLDYVSSLFFQRVTAQTLVRGLHPLRLPATLASLAPAVDFTLSELPPLWAPLLPRAGTIRFPAWVRQEIDLPERAPEAGGWLLPRAVERECERLIRRHRYAMDFTSEPEAMRVFFRRFYRPYVQSRFGAGSYVDDEGGFMERCRGQTLARLHAEGQWVAGLLLKRRGHTLRLGRFGASSNPPAPGASEVLDTLVIRDAHAHGVRRIVMGDTRPCLADGVLRYKARFGAQIRPTLFPQPTIAIQISRWSAALEACIVNQPLVTLRGGQPQVWRLRNPGGVRLIELEPLVRDRA